jgi:hypothetical protein
MKSLSIVIPNWNGRTHLEACLSSIRERGLAHDAEILVVDNASTDGSPDHILHAFPEVDLIRNGVNAGYGPAVNRGVTKSTGRYILVLNSDTLLLKETVPPLLRFLEAHPRVGLTGPRVYRPDNTEQFSARRRLPKPLRFLAQAIGLHRLWPGLNDPYPPTSSPRPVEMLDGCAWLVRRDAWLEVGPMDEQFSFYGEDCDWCRRCAQTPWEIWFVPEAAIVHKGGASSPASLSGALMLQGFRARQHYFNKHYGPVGRTTCRVALVLLEVRRILADSCLLAFSPRRYEKLLARLRKHRKALRWLLTPERRRPPVVEGW